LIEERYGSRARYQALVTDRGAALVKEGYLLSGDLSTVVDHALVRWDDLTRGTALSVK